MTALYRHRCVRIRDTGCATAVSQISRPCNGHAPAVQRLSSICVTNLQRLLQAALRGAQAQLQLARSEAEAHAASAAMAMQARAATQAALCCTALYFTYVA